MIDANVRWLTVSDLEEPYNDALNYRTREQKQFFNRLFLRTDALRKCLSPSIYYLMGEKGTGKTAYAIYLENNSFEDRRSQVITMTETQYRHFIDLKVNEAPAFSRASPKKFDKVQSLLGKWEESSLNPEIEVAFEAVRSLDVSADAGHQDLGKVSAAGRAQNTEKGSQMRLHLLASENKLKTVNFDFPWMISPARTPNFAIGLGPVNTM